MALAEIFFPSLAVNEKPTLTNKKLTLMRLSVNYLPDNDVGIESLVPLPANCIVAKFLRRVKRFTVEAERNGERLLVHTNNTGAMLGLAKTGVEILISPAINPKRKLPFTLERVRLWQPKGRGAWIGVNTALPNKLLEAAFLRGKLKFAVAYERLRREACFGESRLDACLEATGQKRLWIECKNVTLVEDDVAYFPDAASERARKHLQTLMQLVRKGERAAMFYAVQRPDAHCFAPADFIDPEYARLFYQAIGAGVEVYPYQILQLPEGAALGKSLRILPEGKG